MPIITIPYAGTFTVTIKNSSGIVVYGPTTEDGFVAFDPSITTAGDYIITIDNDGAETSFCFNVLGCECPDLVSNELIFVGVTYYKRFVFNYPSDFGCAFRIYIETDFSHGYVPVNGFSDMEELGGGDWLKEITIGGFGHVIWRIELLDGTICYSGEDNGDCISPNLSIASQNSPYQILVYTNDCGDCGTLTANYTQVSPVTTSPTASGTGTHTIDCGTLPDTWAIDVVPDFSASSIVVFEITVTDCCGVTYFKTVTFEGAECLGPGAYPVAGSAIATFTLASGPFIVFDFKASAPFTCAGFSCSGITINYTQINPGIIGLPDSGTVTIPDVCASPYVTGGTVKIPISPNTSYPAYTGASVVAGPGRAIYNVTVNNCCGIVTSGSTP